MYACVYVYACVRKGRDKRSNAINVSLRQPLSSISAKCATQTLFWRLSQGSRAPLKGTTRDRDPKLQASFATTRCQYFLVQYISNPARHLNCTLNI